MKTPPVEVVAAYPALFTWILGVAIFVALASFIYHIRKSDKNNDLQWQTLTSHEQRVSRIEGKCDANHSS